MIYDNIKKICSERNISIRSIEETLNFSNGCIRKWNENEPGIRKIKKVADYLGVSVLRLLDDDPESTEIISGWEKDKEK